MNRMRSATTLLLPVILLYVTGLLMIFDASSGEVVDLVSHKSHFSALFKQLIWGVLSFGIGIAIQDYGWRCIFQKSFSLYVGLIVLLLLVFVPGIGISANGARRWIGFFGFSFQPSEFVKLLLPAFFIKQCFDDQTVFKSFSSFVRLLLKASIPIVLILVEPNNGTVGVIGLMLGVLIVAIGIPTRFWLIPSCIAACGLVIFATNSTYVQNRIASYMNPEGDIKGKGHQPYQAKIAAGSGGVWGVGAAKSMQKLSYLPEAQNDYIAAIFAEEFGFVGMMLLISTYLWLLSEIMRILFRLNSPEAFYWGLAIFFLLAFQTFMNLGVVSGLLPSTGLNLPFFSQGGTSLMANVIGISLLWNMYQEERQKSIESLKNDREKGLKNYSRSMGMSKV